MSIHHGIKFIDQTSSSSVKDVSTAIIGLVATAHDADATVFPANTPVYVEDLDKYIAKAGDAGTLAKSLSAIADICTPEIVVVRVPDTAQDPADSVDMIGAIDANGNATGIKALKLSKSLTGLVPKIIGAPGYSAHAISNELASVGDDLRAFTYFKPDGANITAAITDMPNYGHKNMMAIYPDTNDWSGDAVARALGLRAKLDQQYGFVHKSLSNVVVDGINSISSPVSWDISGIGTNAATLNDANITTIIRNSGFRFWGNRTPSEDANYSFETWVRTDYAIKDMIDAGEFTRIDQPLNKNLISAVLSELNAKGRQMQTLGQIMGLQFYWKDALNPSASLADGKARISYKFTPVSPFESAEFLPEITGEFYIGFGV